MSVPALTSMHVNQLVERGERTDQIDQQQRVDLARADRADRGAAPSTRTAARMRASSSHDLFERDDRSQQPLLPRGSRRDDELRERAAAAPRAHAARLHVVGDVMEVVADRRLEDAVGAAIGVDKIVRVDLERVRVQESRPAVAGRRRRRSRW